MRAEPKKLAAAAISGAAYAALTVLLSPISYGPIQLRLSETLCILPYFMPCTVWGLFLGCALANIVTGNVFDVIFGALATLLAAYLTSLAPRLGGGRASRLAACSAPVAVNALIVGAVITFAYNGVDPLSHGGAFFLNAGQIALGEALVLFAAGLPLLRWLPDNRSFREIAEKINGKPEEK